MYNSSLITSSGYLMAVVVWLSGCAAGNLTKDECRVVDWRGIGYEDGAQGWPETRVAKHRKACAKHGVAMNLDAYRSGWVQGIQNYCQPANGYSQGRSGIKYPGVCPQNLEPDFLEAYRSGRKLHSAEARVQRLAQTLNHKRNRMKQLEVDLRDAGIEMVGGELTTEQRIVLADKIRRMAEERGSAKAEIPVVEAELQRRRKQLQHISAQSAY